MPEVLPALSLQRTPPRNLQPDDDHLFAREFQRNLPAINIETFHNVRVLPEGLVIKGGNIIPLSLRNTKLEKSKYNWIFRLKSWVKRKRLRGKAQRYLLIFDDWSGSYFHWFADSLPRLWLLRNELPNATILLPENFKQLEYVRSSLALFDCTIEYLPSDAYIDIKELIIAQHLAPTGNFYPQILNQLRSYLLTTLKPFPGFNIPNKVYISRHKATKRKVSNELVVSQYMQSVGFEIICFEDYTWQAQYTLAQQAKYWVGLHGAGLMNLLFAPDNTRILELRFQQDRHNNCFYALADALHFPYYYQLCEPLPNPADRLGDALIDIKLLEKNITLLLDKG